MRALRSLATIGCVFAMLGAATSPSFADPPLLIGGGARSPLAKTTRSIASAVKNASQDANTKPYDGIKWGWSGDGLARWEEEQRIEREGQQRDQRLKTLYAVGGKTAKGTPFTADPNAKTGGLRGVKSELGFNQLKGAPPKFPDVGAKKEVIGVAMGLQKKDAPPRQPPRTTDSWITPKTTATTAQQNLYKPVTSLGVKPSVPGTPQQKR